jgi:regulator of sigma D
MNNNYPHISRSRTKELIDKLLAERQQMLVLLWRVSGLEPFPVEKPVNNLLTEFCEILVDYMAAGHFGLYQRIAEGQERRQPVMKLAKDLYPRIEQTTQTAITFNDKYEKLDCEDCLKDLQQDLSRLGVALAIRIDLEDQLIQTLVGHSSPTPVRYH